MSEFTYPEMRAEVISALRSLSDHEYQLRQWIEPRAQPDVYDNLDLSVHILFDDCEVLPSPERAVPSMLRADEVVPLAALGRCLGPMIEELGDSPDSVYLADERWPAVVNAARLALEAMEGRNGSARD